MYRILTPERLDELHNRLQHNSEAEPHLSWLKLFMASLEGDDTRKENDRLKLWGLVDEQNANLAIEFDLTRNQFDMLSRDYWTEVNKGK